MNSELPLSQYISQAVKLENNNFEKKIKIAILSSFTINGLGETLRVKCHEKKIKCITYAGGYNQYNQEILDSNGKLYKFSPDITFLILDVRSILGDLFHFPYSTSVEERRGIINSKVDEIFNLSKVLVENSGSKLILTNFAVPSYSPYGIAETKSEFGLHDMIFELNHRLKKKLMDQNSIFLYDFCGFVLKHGEKNVFDFQNFFFGDIKVALDYIPHLANDLMSYVIAVLGLTKKCIVLDLDNTLWGGIVGEDGFDGIKIGPQPPGNAYLEFQKYLKSLKKRGIILAINSKNNLEDSMKVIREHPHMVLREDDFASMRINWNDKFTNMKEISNELNIGLDSFVFFDDDPVNREYIRTELPEITIPDLPKDPSQYVQILQNLKEFSLLKITEEDSKRARMYLQQRKRNELESQSPNLEGFLKTLDMQITIKKSNNFTIPRISQLTLKTNQFNLTTKRYQEEDIKKFSQDEKMLVGCAQVKDKFGDNGITGVFIVNKNNPNEWVLDTFLLSCRIIGREVEKGILNHIINEAKKNNVSRIRAEYIPTKKNTPIENFLPDCGFVKEGNNWIYDVNNSFRIPEFLKIEVE